MLNRELLMEDIESYKNYLRMDNTKFLDLLRFVENDIKRHDTNMLQCIKANKR